MKNVRPDFLAGRGEMSQRTREFDWSQTPVGHFDQWPQGLKTAVQIMLGSRYAMWLGWGPEFTFFYNDAYAKMTLGSKHPWALGRSAREVWSEIWTDIGPRAESVLRTGEATWDEGLLLFLQRRGFPEETYHTFSYSPLPGDDQGTVGGMLCVVTEDTQRTIGERRLGTLRELAARTMDEARSVAEACQTSAQILAANPQDLPFTLVYLLDSEKQQATLAAATGVDNHHASSPAAIDLTRDEGPWPLRSVVQSGAAIAVDDLPRLVGELTVGAWPESPQQAMVLPLAKPGQTRLAGFLIAGISPRLPLDDSYRGFLELLAGQLAAAVANAQAYEEERQRAEALALLDRAKTAFFSNVSHEFRTPLTLLLGPVEDLLSSNTAELAPQVREQLQIVNRNGVRLLRLVNSLLDFSRIEAGRVRAVYRPTALAELTSELASVFRSAIEGAGLRLNVECPKLPEPVYVDREMWEKIVLNLLSNAFKFTFEGEITIAQRRSGDRIELEVRDTGSRIPADQMSRLFERFHRIENARGRTHEGSGIGLALVQELVKLHGGSIAVESVLGEGSTFTLSIPVGSDHLPKDQIAASPSEAEPRDAAAYIEEAMRWLPDESLDLPSIKNTFANSVTSVENDDRRDTVLVVDDNADMRQYVLRLLAEHYQIIAAGDGETAWAEIERQPPDLVLSDVMMPRLDGFGLLKRLRQNPDTAEIPVIMLSARAGEESRVEGLQAGADDYLVKPFTAKELLARVGSHLQMSRLRKESAERLRKSESRLRIALAAARMVAWEWDLIDDRFRHSDTAEEVLGLQPGSNITDIQSRLAIVHSEDLQHVQTSFQDIEANCREFQIQYRIIRPDNGNIVWIEDRGHAIQDASGKTIRIAGMMMDISDRKRIESALREREAHFRSMADDAPAMLWVTDRNGSCTFLSRGWHEYTGQSQEQGLALGWLNMVHPDDRGQAGVLFQQALAKQGAFSFDYRLRRRDGIYRWANDAARPRFDSEGSFLGHVGAVIDVHERKQVEELRSGQARVLEMITSEQPLDAILIELVRFIERQIPEAIGSISLVDPAGKHLRHAASIHLPPAFQQAIDSVPIGPDSGSSGTDGQHNRQVIVEDFELESPGHHDRDAACAHGLRACWSQPILAGDSALLGTLAIYFQQPRQPEAYELNTLEANARFAGIAIDRPRAQQALRDSEEHLLNALSAADMGRWRANLETGLETRDENLNRILGRPAQQLTEPIEDCFALIHCDDRPTAKAAWEQAIATRGVYEAEFRVVCDDSSIRWLRERGRFVQGSDDEPDAMTGLTQDISHRKAAEEAQRRSAETFAALVEQSPLGIYVVDSQFRIAQVSDGAHHAFQNVQPAIGRDFSEVMHTIWPKPFANEVIGIFRHTLQTGEPYVSPGLTEKRKDIGAIESYEWQVNRVTLADGSYGVVCYYFDTTRLQQASAALRESEARFRMLADNMSQLAWTCDSLGEVNWYNQRWFDYTGRSFEEMRLWGWKSVHHPDHVDRVVQSVTHSRTSGEVWEDTFPLLGADGKYRWFLSRALPIHDEDGEIVQWFGTNTDVTDLREAQQQLHDADRRKDEFLAMLAHELRNPLAPIRTGLDLLAMEEEIAHRDVIELMQEQVKHVVRLVDDLLDVSRIVLGKVDLRKQPTELTAIVKQSVEAVRCTLDNRGHKLTVEVPSQPIWIDADRVRIAQILENLLNNAGKYMDDNGTVELRVCPSGDRVRILVRDRGIGIEPALLPKIFELFTQSPRSLDRSQGGLGIGLTLVQRLVQMHHGKVSVESKGLGHGSLFSVDLPTTTPPDQQSPEETDHPIAIKPRQILVVDDNKGATWLLSALLSKFADHQIHQAHDGETALQAIRELHPEIVLLDIGLPAMNGYQVARAIREDSTYDDVLLIALTGYGQEDDRRRSKQNGFDEHLVKPPSVDQMKLVLTHPKLK